MLMGNDTSWVEITKAQSCRSLNNDTNSGEAIDL